MAGFADALVDLDEAGVDGDVVECGVWRGGHVILARLVSPQRVCWLFDTFEGMTAPSSVDVKVSNKRSAIDSYRDKHSRGERWLAASIGEVRKNFEDTGTLDDSYLRFVVGDVRQVLYCCPLPDKIAMLRLDTDWYDSTKVELEVLYPRLVPGGVLIVDDYGHWEGARRAVNEYFFGQAIKFEKIDYTAVKMVK